MTIFLGPNTDPTTYEWKVCDLLHDQFVRWDQQQIDQYINEARKQLARDTGCLRVLQTSYLTQGQERYQYGQVMGASIVTPGTNYTAPTVSFTGGGGVGAAATLSTSGGGISAVNFTSFGAGYTSNPTMTVSDATGTGAVLVPGILPFSTYDVIGVHLFWGTERYTLQWAPFSLFSAWYRPFQAFAYQRQPGWWSGYGENSVFIAPVPDQVYQIELDTVQLPFVYATADTTTPDVVPDKFTDAVPYFAAFLAKRNSRAFGEAESFRQDYMTRTMDARASFVRRIPDVYQSQ